MHHFWRAVRLALAYRWTLLAAILSALAVGILWGANIATLQPFVEVIVNGRSMQDSIDGKIRDAETKIEAFSSEIRLVEQQLAHATDTDYVAHLQGSLYAARTRLGHEEKALERYQWVRPYVHRWLPNQPFPTLVAVAIALFLGTLVKVIFLIGNTVLVERLANLATLDLRKALFRQTLKMHPAAFDADGTGELMARFTYDIESIYNGLHALFGKAVREPLKMLACLAGAAWVCWRLLLLSLILAPIAAFFVSRLARALKRANRRAMEEMSGIYSLLEETFLGIKVVQAFTMERAERRRFHERSKAYFLRAMRIARYDSLTRPLTELTGIATILLALLCGVYLVLRQKTDLWGIPICDRPLEIGSLILFYGFLTGVSDPGRKLSEVFSRLQRAAAASERVYTMLDRQSQICDPHRPRPLPRHRQELVFRDVSFHYKPGTPVLHGVNLRVPFGETVALVGGNGSGKTTLANLLPRFFDPVEGAVLLDGIDVREVRLRDLRRQIGLVPQHTMLFDDTVLANIRYGCPDATREQVIAAAKKAYAHEFILNQLSDGYETVVGPQGNQLSGGQRQRIALARAILRDPSLLILDEATSQIDVESEQLIHKVLEEFTRDRTAIIITHRLSTLALADRIVVMDAGRIVDSGQYDELVKRCPAFTRLYDLQLSAA